MENHLKITEEIAKRVEELRRQEYSYSRVFDAISEEFPSLKLKKVDGSGYILCREASMLLANLRGNPYNED
jgi:intein-encoded DNA endonuclease-like protein